MDVARDIALVFLSLEALVIALIPLALLSGLAYGVYRLQRIARVYLRKAQVYAQQAHDAVERASQAAARPFMQVHAASARATTIARKLVRR